MRFGMVNKSKPAANVCTLHAFDVPITDSDELTQQ